MSLKAWYPLVNGLYRNQGVSISGDSYETDSPGSETESKLGTSTVTGYTITWSEEKTRSIFNNNELSIAFWIYPTTQNLAQNCIFGVNSDPRRFAIYQYSDTPSISGTTLHWSWDPNDTYSLESRTRGTIPDILKLNTWTHVCFTYSKVFGKITIYIDGIRYEGPLGDNSTLDFKSNVSDFSTSPTLYAANTERYLNDFRVYDHCLSEYEVKELSRGLCCHYSFDGWCPQNIANIANGFKSDDINLEKLNSNTIKASPAANLNSPRFGFIYWMPKITDASKGLNCSSHYAFSAEIYNASSDADIRICFEKGAYADISIIKCSHEFTYDKIKATDIIIESKNEWVTISGIITTPDVYGDFGNQKRYGSEWIMFYPDINEGKFTEGYQLYRNVTLYENPEYYPGDVTNNINDNSGFNNNAVNHNIKNYTKGKIGNKSLVFNGSDSYVQLPKSCKLTDAFTYNIWAYMDDWEKYDEDGGRIISCTDSGGYNIETRDSCIVFAFYSGTDKSYSNNIKTDTAVKSLGKKAWHMFSFSLDVRNNIVKAYIDGIPVKTTFIDNKFDGMFSYNEDNTIYLGAEASSASYEGPFFEGNLDDFRLYGTVLSDEDIKDLYNCRAVVDNKHNLHVSNIKEDTNNIFIDETSSLEYSHISEVQGIKYLEFSCDGSNKNEWNHTTKIDLKLSNGDIVNLIDSSKYNEYGSIVNPATTFKCESILDYKGGTSPYFSHENDVIFTSSSPVYVSDINLRRYYNDDYRTYYRQSIQASSYEDGSNPYYIYNSNNNGSYGNDDTTGLYQETEAGKWFEVPTVFINTSSISKDLLEMNNFKER